MICAWPELLGILPQWLRPEVDRIGKDSLEELRLRINAPPELKIGDRYVLLARHITPADVRFVVDHASSFSPWASESVSRGYLTAPGGHRIGLCGDAVCQQGRVTGLREIHSLCIRVARDFPGIGEAVIQSKGSVLILGAPGWGKTTLLRDMIRKLAEKSPVAVVDERGELFPKGFFRGSRVDVLTGAPKNQGMEMVLRTMGPRWIAVDEITAAEDCAAVLHCYGCGVNLIATAHAFSMADFCSRTVYKQLLGASVFETCFVLRSDKSFRLERITI